MRTEMRIASRKSMCFIQGQGTDGRDRARCGGERQREAGPGIARTTRVLTHCWRYQPLVERVQKPVLLLVELELPARRQKTEA